MAIIQADSTGRVKGKFTIPAGVTAGTKSVRLTGSGGSRAETVFEGSNTLISETRRRIRVRPAPPPPPPPPPRVFVIRFVDPLAQTFSLERASLVSGVDLWFTALGTSDIIVQIRGVIAGVPDDSVIVDARVKPSALSTSGHSRIEFETPARLEGNVEYAIVVLCDDDVSSLAIAELGKWDAANSRWVTSQPYQVGVLLSSSNASAWTPHQDRDLAFRLLVAEFTETSKTIDLGTVDASNASDLMVLADVQHLGSDGDVRFRLTMLDLPDTPAVVVPAWQQVELVNRYTGRVKMEALLEGTAAMTAILLPDVQLAMGDVGESATYVSRQFETGGGANVTVTLESITPGSSTVLVELQEGDQWVRVNPHDSRAVGDGWLESTFKRANFAQPTTRVRITLTGTSAFRPRVAELRVMFT